MANLAEKDYGSDPITWADYRTPSSEYTGRSLGLKGIAEGYVDDPSVTQMRGMLGAAGRQQLGAARSADMASGAARGRLGRGAQQQTQLMAPGMLDALRAQTQQAAQQQQLGRVGYQRGQRQNQMEMRRNAEMAAVLGQESELAAGEAADTAGMASGAVQGAGAGAPFGPLGALAGGLIGGAVGYFAEEGGVVPGDKDEAVPVVAHGGELILSEDASKKLLKALADKDKGTLQAFERDILENKGVLQSFERDAPQERPLLQDRLQPPPSLDAAFAPPTAAQRAAMEEQEGREADRYYPGSDDTSKFLQRMYREDPYEKWIKQQDALPISKESVPLADWEKGKKQYEEDTDWFNNPFKAYWTKAQGLPLGVSTRQDARDRSSALHNYYYARVQAQDAEMRAAKENAHRFEMGREPQAQMTNALSDLDKRLSKDDEIIRQAVESVRGPR